RNHFPVSPHPCRPSIEGMKDLECTFVILIVPLYKPVEPVTVRPVPLHANEIEAFFLDQPFRNMRAPHIVFMRSMTSLAQHDDPGIPDPVHQRLETRLALEGVSPLLDRADRLCLIERCWFRKITGHKPFPRKVCLRLTAGQGR